MAPGQFPGALRFVSLVLHIPQHKGRKAPQERFSEECFRNLPYSETHFSKALLCNFAAHNNAENTQHTASLDELAEPNYYSKYLQTSSTNDFASHFNEKACAIEINSSLLDDALATLVSRALADYALSL